MNDLTSLPNFLRRQTFQKIKGKHDVRVLNKLGITFIRVVTYISKYLKIMRVFGQKQIYIKVPTANFMTY